jgi:hypothetical protein
MSLTTSSDDRDDDDDDDDSDDDGRMMMMMIGLKLLLYSLTILDIGNNMHDARTTSECGIRP